MAERLELPGMMPVRERYPRLRRAVKTAIFVVLLVGLAGYGYEEYQEINKKENHKPIVEEEPSDPLVVAMDILDESRFHKEGEQEIRLPILRGGIAVRSADTASYSVEDPILIQLDSTYDNIIFMAGRDPIKKELVVWQYDPTETKLCKPAGGETKIEMIIPRWSYSDNSFNDPTIGFLVREIHEKCQGTVDLPELPPIIR